MVKKRFYVCKQHIFYLPHKLRKTTQVNQLTEHTGKRFGHFHSRRPHACMQISTAPLGQALNLLDPHCHWFTSLKSLIPEVAWSSSHHPNLGNICIETQTSWASPHWCSSVLKLGSSAPPPVSSQTPPSTWQRPGGGRPLSSGSSSGIFPERSTRSGCKEWPLPLRSPGKHPESHQCRI